jgi:hypothetical protein
MNKEKQIEEMVKDACKLNIACEDCNAHGVCKAQKYAERFYNAGYRKASDVAEELINTALSKIQIMISAIKAQEESGNVTEFNSGAKTALEIVFKDIAELKKKYTEEGK